MSEELRQAIAAFVYEDAGENFNRLADACEAYDARYRTPVQEGQG